MSAPFKTITPFKTIDAAAFAVFEARMNGYIKLNRRSGSFLGQCIGEPSDLSEKQRDWIVGLLDKAGLPPLAGDCA